MFHLCVFRGAHFRFFLHKISFFIYHFDFNLVISFWKKNVKNPNTSDVRIKDPILVILVNFDKANNLQLHFLVKVYVSRKTFWNFLTDFFWKVLTEMELLFALSRPQSIEKMNQYYLSSIKPFARSTYFSFSWNKKNFHEKIASQRKWHLTRCMWKLEGHTIDVQSRGNCNPFWIR